VSPRLFASLLLALLALPGGAWACSCAPAPSAEAALQGAAAVFEARVISGPHGAPEGGQQPWFGQVTYELEVLRSWKGSPEPRTAVSTGSQGAMCGRAFEVGGRYVIYASRSPEGALSDSLCSRTRTLAEAAEDLTALGAGQAMPAAPVRPPPAGAAPPAGDEPAAGDDPGAPEAAASADDAPPEPTAKPPPANPPRGPGAAAGSTPAPAQPAADDAAKPGCSVGGGASCAGLALALPFLVRRRR
jgi:hypothetical protein